MTGANDQAPDTPVPIEEWMDRLELIVHQSSLYENRYVGFVVDVVLPVTDEPRDGVRQWRDKSSRLGCRALGAYPDRCLAEFARVPFLAANTCEQRQVDMQNQSLTDRKRLNNLECLSTRLQISSHLCNVI